MNGARNGAQPSFGETVGAFVMGAVVWGMIERGGGALVGVAAVLNAWLHQPWTQTLLTISLWLLIPYAIGWGLFAVSELHRNASAQRPPTNPAHTSATALTAAMHVDEAPKPRSMAARIAEPEPAPKVSEERVRDGLDSLTAPVTNEVDEVGEVDDEPGTSTERAVYEFEPVRSFRLNSVREVIGAHRPWRAGEAFVVVTDSDDDPLTADSEGLVHTRWFNVYAYASPEEYDSGASPVGRSQAENLLELQEVASHMRRSRSHTWDIRDIPRPRRLASRLSADASLKGSEPRKNHLRHGGTCKVPSQDAGGGRLNFGTMEGLARND